MLQWYLHAEIQLYKIVLYQVISGWTLFYTFFVSAPTDNNAPARKQTY